MKMNRTIPLIIIAVILALAAPVWAEPYHGNQNSKVFHAPGCKDYDCKNCVVTFEAIEAATKAGFRPHKSCVQSANNAQAKPSKAQEPFTAQVISVADGDTITVQTEDYEQIKIRLYGIDAPEMNQPGGKEARQYLYDRIYGKEVIVKVMDTDRYGRSVAMIYLYGGMAVSVDIVGDGHAWVYPQYCKVKNFCDALTEVEGEAKAEKVGIWADPNPVPPWEWRKK